MNDPLYAMQPSDEGWLRELAEEAEALSVAVYQDDYERAERKAKELLDALPRWLAHLNS